MVFLGKKKQKNLEKKMVEMAGFEPAVTLYKNDTTVTPTTALQTKTNPPKGGCLCGGN